METIRDARKSAFGANLSLEEIIQFELIADTLPDEVKTLKYFEAYLLKGLFLDIRSLRLAEISCLNLLNDGKASIEYRITFGVD